MTPHSESDCNRIAFFNDHADKWMDMFYLNEESGVYDRHEEKFRRLFSHIPLKSGDTVLDAGCGCGVLVPFILGRIGETGRLYEMDYAHKMIDKNRELHNDSRIEFLVRSVEKTGLSCGSLDAAICFSCFPHFDNKAGTLAEINRILKEGGSLTIAHFDSAEEINNRHSKHMSVKHDHLPPETAMRSLLEQAGFAIGAFLDEPGFYLILATKTGSR